MSVYLNSFCSLDRKLCKESTTNTPSPLLSTALTPPKIDQPLPPPMPQTTDTRTHTHTHKHVCGMHMYVPIIATHITEAIIQLHYILEYSNFILSRANT